MIASTAAAIIQTKLGFRSDQITNIIARMTEACRLLERGRTLPKFLIQEDQSLSLTAAINYVALPTGFLKIVDDDYPYYTNSDDGTTYLEVADWDDIRRLYAAEENGPPKAFAIRKSRMYVGPTPAIDTTLTWSYYKASDDVEAAGENTWMANAPYLIIGHAGLLMANDLQSAPAIKQGFSSMISQWERAVFAESVEQETNGPIIMGASL